MQNAPVATGLRWLSIAAVALSMAFGTRTASAQGVTAVIDFESHSTGEVVSSVDGDAAGTAVGPIGLDGSIPSDPGTNRALIFDSSNPTGGDFDLGSPNNTFGGPGMGPAGEMGQPFENSFPLGKILIFAEDLVDTSPADGFVDDPDDAAQSDMIFDFDFSTITAPFVPTDITIFEITTIDGEASEAPGTARLYDSSGSLIAAFSLGATGCNGVRIHTIGAAGVGVSGVHRMEVELDGSGGIDGIVFEATPPVTPPICELTPAGVPVAGGEEYTVEVGQTLTFTVYGESTTYDASVVITEIGLPAGAVHTPALPLDSSPGTSTSSVFTWTPTAADIGTHPFWYHVTDEFGGDTVCDPIIHVVCSGQIDTQPNDQTVCEGDSVSFSVDASGTATITYQWRKDGVAIPGATSSTFTIGAATSSNGGTYDVVVTNPCVTLTSAPAALTVQTTPTVSDPDDQTVCVGSDVSFTVSVTGDPAPTIQWRKNGSPISGETGTTLSLTGVTEANAGSYDAVVTNGCGSDTSEAAVLTVEVAPTIVQVSVDSMTPCQGSSVTFMATVDGSAPITLQWRRNGSAIPGATGSSFTIASVGVGDSGTYDIVATNSCGSATSSGVAITVRTPAAITAQPQSQTVCEDDSVTVTVTATGSTPLTYQWNFNGSAIPGATNTSFSIATASVADAGSYTVTVANECGSVTSSAADLTVRTPPVIDVDPSDMTVCEGDAATFSITASGSGPLSYQWSKDGTAIPGATSSSLTVMSSSPSDAGVYSATVTNDCGSATSAGALLTVRTAAEITANPAGGTVCAGDSVTFSVTASGSDPISYQWSKDGSTIPGATMNSFTIASAATGDAGSYSVTATNDCGSATSTAAVLVVETAPAITSDPLSSTVCEGDSASFSITATGSAPLMYQWFKDGTAIPGATGSAFTLAGAAVSDAGTYSVEVSNNCGTATSSGAVLTVEIAPAITAQPSSTSVCEGDMASFAVTATGDAPLLFQWFKDGIAVPGATGSTYSIASAALGDAGSYSVSVENDCGTAISDAATLTVDTAPEITSQPLGSTSCEGDSVTFSVTATGTAPLSYQWSKDGTAIPGATSATYMIAAAAVGDAGNYSVEVTNACGSATSVGATLTVGVAAAIVTGPASVTGCEGDSATFMVTASGDAPLTYQWFLDGAAIPGATSDSYLIAAMAAGDAGSYTVTVTNDCGTATSGAATLTVDTAAAITSQPSSATACSGDSASFSVTATGTAPLTYQWFMNGAMIPGATGDSYMIPATTVGDAGTYTVEVTNVCGTATSMGATLVVQARAEIVASPDDVTACEGDSATFTATASGDAPLTFQWLMNGTAIPGATSSSYTIASVSTADAGDFSVTVSNDCGSATSDPASLVVQTAPTITADPQDETTCEGMSASFSVAAAGSAPLSYQWFVDGSPIAGATSASFDVAAAATADAGNYTVEVSNACGTVTSGGGNLSVLTPPSVTDPADADVCEGDPISMSVTASGSSPFTYQWRRDGVDIPGATMSSFDIPSPVASDAGSYDVVVSNDCGSVTSGSANVTVGEAPTITAQPVGGMFAVGATVTLTVAVDGTGPFSYQWLLDGLEILGETGSTLTITDAQPTDSGVYEVVITNACGSVTSQIATVMVDPDPDPAFIRGDCNSDGIVNMADAIKIMRFTFQGFPVSSCLSACDHNDDGMVDLGDVIYMLQYIFLDGAAPPSPFGECLPDPTPSGETCLEYTCP